MNREKLKGHLAILITAIIFGLNIPVTKSLLLEGWVSSDAVTYLRMIIGAIVFWLASFFMKSEKVTPKDMFLLFICGLFGVLLNQGSFIQGLNYTSPINAGLVATVTPLLVMVLSAIFLKEPITMKKAGGVMLGGLGAILIILSSAGENSSASASNAMLGNLMCFFSALSYAIYLVISKPIMSRYTPLTIMKWMFLYAAVLALPFEYQSVIDAPVFQGGASWNVWWRMIYFTLFATCLTYFLIPIALKRIRPTTVGMYNYVQPLVAAVVAVIIGQDILTWQDPVAAILIFSGVYFVTMSKSRADVERELAEKNKKTDNI